MRMYSAYDQRQLNAHKYLHITLSRAKEAKVPVSVHLDHATDAEHLEFVLELAQQGIRFDSIMVDASHAEVC